MQKALFKSHGKMLDKVELESLLTLEIGNTIKPGERIPLMALNPNRYAKGRRFAYIGIDHGIHIGRFGKPYNPARLPMM